MKKWIALALCASISAVAYCEENVLTQEQLDKSYLDAAGKPVVEAYLVPADAVEKMPKLKSLLSFDKDFNKMVFRLKNFPTDKEVVLEEKRLASLTPSAYTQAMSFTISPDGTIVTSDQKKLPALVLSGKGFLPGERVTFRFRIVESGQSEEVTLYPTPIVARNKVGEVVLRAELISLIPTVYNIEMPTLKEGEDYEFVSTSLGEVVKSKAKYSKDTPIHYSPEVEGHAKGSTSRLEIKRKSVDPIVVTFPWGTLLKSYLSGDLSYP